MELRQAAEADPSYTPLLFVHPSRPADGDDFFAWTWPEARAVADPTRDLYRAFGLGRGTFGQVFGPAVLACGLRAVRKGHGLGPPRGDPWQMPGLFLVAEERIVWQHVGRHIGEHPDFAAIPRQSG